MLYLLACFSSPFPQTSVPGYFFHPLAFFPPPWFLQFLHLLLGLQSSLTACARLPALYSIWPSCPVSHEPKCKFQNWVVLVFWLLWSARKQAWKLGQSNSKLCLAALQGQYGSAFLIDHTDVSVVRWELLSLSSMGILLPKAMQIAAWELSLHYADRCRKFPPVITWCFFSLWGDPYGG